jgi:hypothetical protein
VQIAAITSGFANNTTLSDLEFQGCRDADLALVLTALQDHPTLQKIHLNKGYVYYLPSLSGLEVLLRSQDSKIKELILEEVDTTRTVGLYPVHSRLTSKHGPTIFGTGFERSREHGSGRDCSSAIPQYIHQVS